jgi:hypothetical protein
MYQPRKRTLDPRATLSRSLSRCKVEGTGPDMSSCRPCEARVERVGQAEVQCTPNLGPSAHVPAKLARRHHTSHAHARPIHYLPRNQATTIDSLHISPRPPLLPLLSHTHPLQQPFLHPPKPQADCGPPAPASLASPAPPSRGTATQPNSPLLSRPAHTPHPTNTRP